MDSRLEVIDAFIDGERVDVEALKDALSAAEGRDYFIDVWTLREAVGQDRDGVSEAAPVNTAARRTVRWWTVAAALVAGLAAGYVAGNRPAGAPSVDMPAPTAIATAPASPGNIVFPAPQPTRVIQLEFQLEATRGGGD